MSAVTVPGRAAVGLTAPPWPAGSREGSRASLRGLLWPLPSRTQRVPLGHPSALASPQLVGSKTRALHKAWKEGGASLGRGAGTVWLRTSTLPVSESAAAAAGRPLCGPWAGWTCVRDAITAPGAEASVLPGGLGRGGGLPWVLGARPVTGRGRGCAQGLLAGVLAVGSRAARTGPREAFHAAAWSDRCDGHSGKRGGHGGPGRAGAEPVTSSRHRSVALEATRERDPSLSSP